MKTSSGKVAFFLPSLGGGGAERMILNLARGFAERGFKVDLVLARAEGPYLSQVPSEARVVDLGARRVLYALPGLVHYLRRERPQAMLSTLSHANIVALWARVIGRVPTRLVIREANTTRISVSGGPPLRRRLIPVFMRLFYLGADAVVANSFGVAEDLAKLGVPPDKIKVIYNPVVTPELFAKAEESVDHSWFRPDEPPVILGVGRLTKQKDFPTLIRAFALVRKERLARLMILGEGEERPKLEALVRELGLKEDVVLPGFVDNPYKYMKRAGVFVLPSLWEGLPNVLIEALALGTPVVATDCPGGSREILEGGKWGKLVSVGDVEALADAIVAVLSNPKLPEGAVERITRLFGLENIMAEYLRVMELE